MKNKTLSRRRFLGSVAMVAGAVSLPASTLIAARKPFTLRDDGPERLFRNDGPERPFPSGDETGVNDELRTTDGPEWPLPYVELDREPVMKLAHDTFFMGGCAYGTFHAFVQSMRDRIAGPYDGIPTQMLKFGKGGVLEVGTLCGALTGTLAAINLVSQNWDKMCKELLHWYAQTYLPTDETNEMAVQHEFDVIKHEGPIEQSLSHSPLCHVSVTRWCEVSGATVTSPHRAERCGRVVAATIGQAVEMLNKEYWGEYAPTYHTTEDAEKCLACHGKMGTKANVLSEMKCTQCHGNPHAK